MRRSNVWTSLLVGLACSIGSAPRPAIADTYPMAAGVQTNASTRCFEWHSFSEGAIGTVKTAECISHYVQPVYWRTFPSGIRTVHVRGKRASVDSEGGCTLFVFDSNGFVVSQDSGSFTTVGSYTWVDLDVTGVTSSTTSFISCGLAPDSQTYLLMMHFVA
jgi:hypothetical protein